MNIVILTTDTPCHAQFVAHVNWHFPVSRVFVEKERPPAPWWAEHEMDEKRDAYERVLFRHTPTIKSLPVQVSEVENVNGAVDDIGVGNPDVVIVYGTGKLSPEVIEICPNIFNLHGGDAEKYRGLDSSLWAIYWGDFDAIAVTLHRVEPTLDTGDIVGVRKILLRKAMLAHELRAEAAKNCNDMVCNLLERFEEGKPILSTPQLTKGRYFSFMPACLKYHVERKFKEYVHDI